MSTLMPAPPRQAPPAQPPQVAPPPVQPKPQVTRVIVALLVAGFLALAAIGVGVYIGLPDDPGSGPVVTAPEAPAQPKAPAEPAGPTQAMKAAQAMIRHLPAYITPSQERQYCSLAKDVGAQGAASETQKYQDNPGTLGYMVVKTADKFGVTLQQMFAEYIKICP